jgi:cytochrome c oxidase subunit 4
VRRYLIVWLALLAATALTCALSFAPTGPWGLPIALFIAAAKSALVVLFFMHLWDQGGMYRVTLGMALGFVALLITLTVGDIATRFPPSRPDGKMAGIPPEEQLEPLPASNPVQPIP